MVLNADLFLIIGTSMQVYPAAGLIDYATCPVFIIDPNSEMESSRFMTIIKKPATEGILDFINSL